MLDERRLDGSGAGLPAVLVTRPEPGASETAERLRGLGFRAVMAPFLVVRPCQVALPAAAGLQAVVAASGNAVDLPTGYHHLPLLAVGQATAARARKAGFCNVQSAGGDAADLAALAARLLSPAAGVVLLSAGRGQGMRLARALRRNGLRVHRRATYAADPARRFPDAAAVALREGLRAAVFFSAETARAFVRLLPRRSRSFLHGTDALAIGPAAAVALQGLPWRDVRVAVRPTQEGVLALL